MKGCFHSTDEGLQLVQKMNTEFGLSVESASYIADVSGTSIDMNHKKGIPSKLFRDLVAMYGSTEQAAKIKSICYSPEFIEKFGDWITDIFCGATNSDGEPEIVWTHQAQGDKYLKFENSVGMAIANALDEKIELDRAEFGKYKDTVNKLRVFTILKDKFDAGQKLSQDEIQHITGKSRATKEETRLALLKGILSSYKALRHMLSGIHLTPAFVSYDGFKHYNSVTSSYTVKDWDKVIKLDDGVIPALSLFPTFLSTSVALKPDRKTAIFNMEGKNFKINPNITFDIVDQYFSTTQVGQNKTNVQIDAWNNFKAGNTDFIERLLNKKSDLIHFLEAFTSYKQSLRKEMSGRGRQINEEAFEFARRSVILTDDPIFGIAKFAIITNTNIPNKLENLKALEDELYADGSRDQWGIPSSPYYDKAAHQARFAELFGNVNQINSQEALQKLIDINSPLAAVAKVLLKQGANVTINFQDDLIPINGINRAGVYDPNTNTVILSRQTYLYPDSLLLHELIHAHTYDAVRSDAYRDKAVKIFNEARKLIFQKYNVSSYEELVDKMGTRFAYGFQNVDEFFSELWTNGQFITELNRVGTQKKTVWQKIKEFLLNTLHISKTSQIFDDASTLLDEMISNTGESYFYRKELEGDQDFLAQLESLPNDFFVETPLGSRPYEGDEFYGDIQSVAEYFGINKGTVAPITSDIKPLQDWILHSGGAEGSDTQWAKIGAEFGVTPNHYYHGRRTPLGNIEITEEEFELGKKKVYHANEYLNRGNITSYMDLLARNYIQVRNSDQVVAVGVISKGVENEDGKIWNAAVDGGTGWAVEMAIEENKPVYVYDQNRQQWYRNVNYSAGAGLRYFEPCDTPVLSKNFAGIGTREINEAGIQAIRDCYTHTIIDSAEDIAKYRGILDKEGLGQGTALYIFDEVKGDEGDKVPAHFADLTSLYNDIMPIYLIDITTGNQYQYDELLNYFAPTSIELIEHDASIKAYNTEAAVKALHNLLAKSSLIKNPRQAVQSYEELHQQPQQASLFTGSIQTLAETATASMAIHPITFNKEQKTAIDGAVSAYRNKGRKQDIVTIIGKAGTGKTTIIGEILK